MHIYKSVDIFLESDSKIKHIATLKCKCNTLYRLVTIASETNHADFVWDIQIWQLLHYTFRPCYMYVRFHKRLYIIIQFLYTHKLIPWISYLRTLHEKYISFISYRKCYIGHIFWDCPCFMESRWWYDFFHINMRWIPWMLHYLKTKIKKK